MIFAACFMLRGRDTHIDFLESIFLSRVEGRGSRVEGSISRIEGNNFLIFFLFFWRKMSLAACGSRNYKITNKGYAAKLAIKARP